MKIAWLLAASALLTAGAVQAHDFTQGAIAIDHPWARPTPEGAKAGAAYVSIENTGAEADVLVSAGTPVSEKTQIHEILHDSEVMKMREVQGGIPVPAGASVTLKPGGYHIMLLGLKQKLTEGQNIPLTLTFAKAGSVAVEAKVEKAPPPEAAMAKSPNMDHMH